MKNSALTPTVDAGFTLIELMVTIALIAILLALAAPSLNEFAIKSRIKNVGNEFASSVLKVRNEAISKNTCMTLCMSDTIDSALPSCKTTGSDWQVGWIGFINTTCDTTIAGPTSIEDVVLARRSIGDNYMLNSQASTPRRKLTFNTRGYPSLNGADEFDLTYSSQNDPMNEKYAFNICIDKLGRTRTISYMGTC